MFKHFVFRGIEVPYMPSQVVTNIREGKEVVEEVMPAHISALQRGDIPAAIECAAREIALSLVNELGATFPVMEAPIALSAHVPERMFVFDGERIILNEKESLASARDADGDRACLILSQDEMRAVLVKFPITQKPPVLHRMMEQEKGHKITIRETFYNLEFSKYYPNSEGKYLPGDEEKEYNIREQFEKNHQPNQTGLITTLWNCKELYEARKDNMTFHQTINHLCSDPQRFQDIELGELKSISKDSKNKTKAEIMSWNKLLSHRHAPFLTSSKRITSMSFRNIRWLLQTDLDKLSDEIQHLKITFRNSNPAKETVVIEKPIVDRELLHRLYNFKLLRSSKPGTFPKISEKVPEARIVWCTDQKGNPVALTDVKRETFGYTYVLYPIYDVKYGEFRDPLSHMAEELSKLTFTRIIIPESNQFVGYWPRADYYDKTKMWSGETWNRKAKLTMLLQAITEYCGMYGDMVRSERTSTGFSLTPNATAVAALTIAVDYRDVTDTDEKWEILNKVNDIVPICRAGGKSNDQQIKKYVISRGNDIPAWIPDSYLDAHPRRTACQRAQLLKSEPAETYKVAVVHMDTMTQALICESGIEKQLKSTCFLPQVSNVQDENYPDRRVVRTWSGEEKVVYLSDPRKSIRIGKLIDIFGNKFMPRYYPQAYCGEEFQDKIDILFPIHELVDKEAHRAILKDFREEVILVNGKEVTALVGEHVFMRTGSESENVRPSKGKTITVRGIDKFPILSSVQTMFPNITLGDIDLTYAKELQQAVKRILSNVYI